MRLTCTCATGSSRQCAPVLPCLQLEARCSFYQSLSANDRSGCSGAHPNDHSCFVVAVGAASNEVPQLQRECPPLNPPAHREPPQNGLQSPQVSAATGAHCLVDSEKKWSFLFTLRIRKFYWVRVFSTVTDAIQTACTIQILRRKTISKQQRRCS